MVYFRIHLFHTRKPDIFGLFCLAASLYQSTNCTSPVYFSFNNHIRISETEVTTVAQESAYYDIIRRSEVKEESRKLRRLFLRYKEAEIVYSIQHKKLLELAGKAGAIYRIDGTVLINRDIFENYLEQFHEKSTLLGKDK